MSVMLRNGSESCPVAEKTKTTKETKSKFPSCVQQGLWCWGIGSHCCFSYSRRQEQSERNICTLKVMLCWENFRRTRQEEKLNHLILLMLKAVMLKNGSQGFPVPELVRIENKTKQDVRLLMFLVVFGSGRRERKSTKYNRLILLTVRVVLSCNLPHVCFFLSATKQK